MPVLLRKFGSIFKVDRGKQPQICYSQVQAKTPSSLTKFIAHPHVLKLLDTQTKTSSTSKLLPKLIYFGLPQLNISL